MPPGPWQGSGLTEEMREAYRQELQAFVARRRLAASASTCSPRGRGRARGARRGGRVSARVIDGDAWARRVQNGSWDRSPRSPAAGDLPLARGAARAAPGRRGPARRRSCSPWTSRHRRSVRWRAGVAGARVVRPVDDGPHRGVAVWRRARGALPAEIAELDRRLEAEGRNEFHDAIVRANLAGAAPAEVVVVGKPWREIVRLAREGAADLIVMASRAAARSTSRSSGRRRRRHSRGAVSGAHGARPD